MKLTYYGHSCFMLDTGLFKILFDPFITGNDLAKDIDISTIMPHFICVSHGHSDHIADCERIALQSGATVISSWEIYEWLGKRGLTKLHPMNTGGSWLFDFGRIKCVEAVHSSGLPDGSYGGNPLGFLLYVDNKIIYYAGDTALTLNMKLIGEYHKPDWALLPVGSNFTMDIQDAVIASQFIQCDKIVAMHYDTFGYIKVDHQEVVDSFTKAGKQVTMMSIGTSIEL
ncbi:MAG: metal-dependent hydrolase [Bacteroidetes bacterium]|nr:metal-dependent hydrolase [Bacteroidota bacterium]